MDKVINTLQHIWSVKTLRDKIIFTLFILVIFRILAHVTIPGADVAQIKTALNPEDGSNGALGVLSLLTGGAMQNFSIVLMGLTPYINASIIMQLLGVIVPSIENLKKEGEQGQMKINQYTRALTIPLAFLQSYGMMALINRFSTSGNIINLQDWPTTLMMMSVITAGTIFLMWLGELVSEKGIGNGISLIIFAGIVSHVPVSLYQSFNFSLPVALAALVATVLLTVAVVYVAEGDRRVPVVYASKKSNMGQRSFLPLKIMQAGMIPIIFAVSLISFPSIAAQIFRDTSSEAGQVVIDFILTHLNPGSASFWYNIFYALLIVGFTYFYVSIVFDPKKIAENIQKRSGYIPGYRPGTETENYLSDIMSRLNFWGGSFLAFVAISPLFFSRWISGGTNSVELFISGAGIIIVVSVVLDIIRRINAHLVTHDYSKL